MSDQGQVSTSIFYTVDPKNVPLSYRTEYGGLQERIPRDRSFDTFSLIQVDAVSNGHRPETSLQAADAIPLGIPYENQMSEPFVFHDLELGRIDINSKKLFMRKQDVGYKGPQDVGEYQGLGFDTINTDGLPRFKEEFRSRSRIDLDPPPPKVVQFYELQIYEMCAFAQNYHPDLTKITLFDFSDMVRRQVSVGNLKSALISFMNRILELEKKEFGIETPGEVAEALREVLRGNYSDPLNITLYIQKLESYPYNRSSAFFGSIFLPKSPNQQSNMTSHIERLRSRLQLIVQSQRSSNSAGAINEDKSLGQNDLYVQENAAASAGEAIQRIMWCRQGEINLPDEAIFDAEFLDHNLQMVRTLCEQGFSEPMDASYDAPAIVKLHWNRNLPKRLKAQQTVIDTLSIAEWAGLVVRVIPNLQVPHWFVPCYPQRDAQNIETLAGWYLGIGASLSADAPSSTKKPPGVGFSLLQYAVENFFGRSKVDEEKAQSVPLRTWGPISREQYDQIIDFLLRGEAVDDQVKQDYLDTHPTEIERIQRLYQDESIPDKKLLNYGQSDSEKDVGQLAYSMRHPEKAFSKEFLDKHYGKGKDNDVLFEEFFSYLLNPEDIPEAFMDVEAPLPYISPVVPGPGIQPPAPAVVDIDMADPDLPYRLPEIRMKGPDKPLPKPPVEPPMEVDKPRKSVLYKEPAAPAVRPRDRKRGQVGEHMLAPEPKDQRMGQRKRGADGEHMLAPDPKDQKMGSRKRGREDNNERKRKR